jgi:hypothetical protein
MGLGKTMTALALTTMLQIKKIVIVCPAINIRNTWEA